MENIQQAILEAINKMHELLTDRKDIEEEDIKIDIAIANTTIYVVILSPVFTSEDVFPLSLLSLLLLLLLILMFISLPDLLGLLLLFVKEHCFLL